MLQFRKLTISDRDWAQHFIEAEDSRSADYNFGNIYMWDGAYRQHLRVLRPHAEDDVLPSLPEPAALAGQTLASEAFPVVHMLHLSLC